jgi:hypothetical protein
MKKTEITKDPGSLTKDPGSLTNVKVIATTPASAPLAPPNDR